MAFIASQKAIAGNLNCLAVSGGGHKLIVEGAYLVKGMLCLALAMNMIIIVGLPGCPNVFSLTPRLWRWTRPSPLLSLFWTRLAVSSRTSAQSPVCPPRSPPTSANSAVIAVTCMAIFIAFQDEYTIHAPDMLVYLYPIISSLQRATLLQYMCHHLHVRENFHV